jgi:hypothetical protein
LQQFFNQWREKMKNTVIVQKEAKKIVRAYGSLRAAQKATGIHYSVWSRYCSGQIEPQKDKAVKAFLKAIKKVERECGK